MAKLKLTYFDFDGGRGEPARLAMHIGGVAFEDERIAGPDWPKHRDRMPFRAMPVLEVDGKVIAHSNTILRYVGKAAGLYPKDDWQAALADEAMDAAEDLGTRIGNTIALADADKKKAREDLATGAIPRFLDQLVKRLQAGGGEWFADKRLTVADLKVYQVVKWIRSGVLDHIPKDVVPAELVKHLERVAAHPKVAGYYAARKK